MNSIRAWLQARTHRPIMVLLAVFCFVRAFVVTVENGGPLWLAPVCGTAMFLVVGGTFRIVVAFFNWVDDDDA